MILFKPVLRVERKTKLKMKDVFELPAMKVKKKKKKPKKKKDTLKEKLKEHAKHHSKKHMTEMKKDMAKGMSFKDAHYKAKKKVGK